MGVARVSGLVLFVSGVLAVTVLLAPEVGLWRFRRASAWVSVAGAAMAGTVFVLQVVVPLTHGALLAWPQDYFLAMAHSFEAVSPYPFMWNPRWAYELGTLTPLIAAGGVFALAAGYPALRAGKWGAAIPTTVGVCAVVAYVVGAVFTAVWSWHGIPV